MSDANITIPVDLTNPGQVFACCGLLELADRLWPGAEVTGGFSPPRFQRSLFQVFARATFSSSELVKVLVNCERTAVDPYQPIQGSDGMPVKDANKIKPVLLQHNPTVGGEPFSIRLSWWLDELEGKQSPFKTWSAHNSAASLVADLSRRVRPDDIKDENLLEQRADATSRLGLDPRSSWNTLDTGFSPNDQQLPVDTYAATELLAAVGLETFRPAPARLTKTGRTSAAMCAISPGLLQGDPTWDIEVGRPEKRYTYAVWTDPLPVIVARVTASGNLHIEGITSYSFEVAPRGRFKYFTKSSLLERNNHG